jgi:hypothetical protein
MQDTAGLLAKNDTDCTYFQNDLRKKYFLAHFRFYREGFYVPCTAAVGVASGAKRCERPLPEGGALKLPLKVKNILDLKSRSGYLCGFA